MPRDVHDVQSFLGPKYPKKGSASEVQARQGSHAQPGTPDLIALSPHLQKQWHLENNLLFGSKVMKPHSCLRANGSASTVQLANLTSFPSQCLIRQAEAGVPFAETALVSIAR